MTDADRELKRRAEAATPGPWKQQSDGIRLRLVMGSGGQVVADTDTKFNAPPQTTVDANAAFIAAANPAVILDLIERLRKFETWAKTLIRADADLDSHEGFLQPKDYAILKELGCW